MAKKNTKKEATTKQTKKGNNKKAEKKVAIKNDSLESALDEIVEEETTWIESTPNEEELKEVRIPFLQVLDEVETNEDISTTIKHTTTITEETSTTASTIEITTEDVIEETVVEEKPSRRFKYESNGSCDELPLIMTTPYKKNHKKIRLNFED